MRFLAGLLGLGFALTVHAESENLETRVQLLEQRLSSSAMRDMMRQTDQLQHEVQELRGQLESIQHRLTRMEETQRTQYLDIDARLRRLTGEKSHTESPQASPPQLPEPAAELPSPAPVQSTQKPATPASQQSSQAYREAYETLQAGHYDAAVDAFSDFLQRYPEGELSDNAWYWLGEAYYVKRDFKAARQSFQQVVEGYPNSAKTSAALLKLGYVAYEEKRWQEARQHLEEVVARFPDSRAASLAADRLKRMESERR
ncbi:MAG: tol-pal system protein YbgF [Methylothermaceae bacterium]|nr:tol-pal system protein YbgF [Methylothermaceae bacterium]